MIQTGWITPELEPQVIASVPLGRIGQPDDVADVIVFLATDQAQWLTGQTLYSRWRASHGVARQPERMYTL